MKRTITMNLSGIIFHIEEDAYEILNKYLTTIKSYFKDSEGRDEIMNDIESRIAEMLQEKVNKTKQAVLITDVESVIAVMGKPEDFAGERENTHQSTENKESQTTYSSAKRRVFRDPDEKILGGVCSGIANYFDFDPMWLRAAFAFSFFVFGSGLLLYIILWIIIPAAKTTAEKLEMRGEKVDINNIGKAVKEEFEDVKNRVNENKTSIHKFVDFIMDVFYNVVKVAGKFFAIIFLFIAIVLLIALLGALFGTSSIIHFNGDHVISLYDITDSIFPHDFPMTLIILGVLLFVGIPIISIIYSCIKFLMGIKSKNRIIKYTFNILWISGLIILVYAGIKTGNDFRSDATSKQNIPLIQKDTLYLFVNEDYETKANYRIGRTQWNFTERDNKLIGFNSPILDIQPSKTDSFQLVLIKNASGTDSKEAFSRAKNIEYTITQDDSKIWFNRYFEIKDNEKFRAQNVKIILKVPVNKVIFLSNQMENIIFDIDNVNNTSDSDMVNRRWIMTKQGLQCIDCNGLENINQNDISLPPPTPKKISNMYVMK